MTADVTGIDPGIIGGVAEANQTYGELAAHPLIAGYTLELGFQRLEALLVGDAWTQVGPGFADVNAFMDSIRLDQFKALAEDRQRIVKRIKQLQPAVTNRAIARALGVGHDTIDRDLVQRFQNSNHICRTELQHFPG
jgi:hypothetical protein